MQLDITDLNRYYFEIEGLNLNELICEESMIGAVELSQQLLFIFYVEAAPHRKRIRENGINHKPCHWGACINIKMCKIFTTYHLLIRNFACT